MTTCQFTNYKLREDITLAVQNGYLIPIQSDKIRKNEIPESNRQTPSPALNSFQSHSHPILSYQSMFSSNPQHSAVNTQSTIFNLDQDHNKRNHSASQLQSIPNEFNSNPHQYSLSNSFMSQTSHDNRDKSAPIHSLSCNTIVPVSQPVSEVAALNSWNDDVNLLCSNTNNNTQTDTTKRRDSSIVFMQKVASYSQRRESSISIEQLLRSQSQTETNTQPQNDDDNRSELTVMSQPQSANAMCFCGESYGTEAQLQRHLKTHSNVRFKCKDCGQIHKSKADLVRHLRNIEDHYMDFEQFIEYIEVKEESQTKVKRKRKQSKSTKQPKQKRRKIDHDTSTRDIEALVDKLDQFATLHKGKVPKMSYLPKMYKIGRPKSRKIWDLYAKRHKLTKDQMKQVGVRMTYKDGKWDVLSKQVKPTNTTPKKRKTPNTSNSIARNTKPKHRVKGHGFFARREHAKNPSKAKDKPVWSIKRDSRGYSVIVCDFCDAQCDMQKGYYNKENSDCCHDCYDKGEPYKHRLPPCI
eukprot:276603_1